MNSRNAVDHPIELWLDTDFRYLLALSVGSREQDPLYDATVVDEPTPHIVWRAGPDYEAPVPDRAVTHGYLGTTFSTVVVEGQFSGLLVTSKIRSVDAKSLVAEGALSRYAPAGLGEVIRMFQQEPASLASSFRLDGDVGLMTSGYKGSLLSDDDARVVQKAWRAMSMWLLTQEEPGFITRRLA